MNDVKAPMEFQIMDLRDEVERLENKLDLAYSFTAAEILREQLHDKTTKLRKLEKQYVKERIRDSKRNTD